jgi:hypothetical protein
MPWNVYSIRERNLMFIRAVEGILDLDVEGKTWDDVRTELSDEQVRRIHIAYAALWPPETNVSDLLPRPDPSVFRGVYVGLIDPRTIAVSVHPGGHPKSPTRGRVKIPHLDAVNWRRSALS